MLKIQLGIKNVKLVLIMSVYVVLCLCLTSINIKYSINIKGFNFQFSTVYAVVILSIISISSFFVKKSSISKEMAYFIGWTVFEIVIILVMSMFRDVSFMCTIDELIVLLVPFVLCIHMKEYVINKIGILLAIVTVGNFVSLQVYIYTMFYSVAQRLLGWGVNRFGAASVRADTTMGAATSSSIYLYTIVVICLYLLGQELSKFWRRYVYISLGITLFAQLLLQTRSGLVMSALVVLYYLLKSKNYKIKRYLIRAFSLGAVCIISLKKEIVLDIINRIKNLDNYTAASDLLRKQLIENGLMKWNENICFGSGMGQGLTRLNQINRMSNTIGNPHNQYISFLIDFGLIGILLFSICIIIFFVDVFRNKKDKFLLISSVCMLLVAFNTETLFTQSLRGAIIVWNLVIVIVLSRNDSNIEKDDGNEKNSNIHTTRCG